MFKRWSVLWGALLVLMAALAACQPATPRVSNGASEPTETATVAAATVAPTEPPSAAPTEATPAPSEPTSPPAATPVPGATSAPQPTPPWIIPEIREGDWVKGPEEAGVTIVEYSDFQ